jgi:hypothetical protein
LQLAGAVGRNKDVVCEVLAWGVQQRNKGHADDYRLAIRGMGKRKKGRKERVKGMKVRVLPWIRGVER